MFCQNCGKEIDENAVICIHCGCETPKNKKKNEREWLITLLLCIFLGGFGAHRFYTGYIGIGIVQLLTVGGCGIWTLIDFICILCKKYQTEDGQDLV